VISAASRYEEDERTGDDRLQLLEAVLRIFGSLVLLGSLPLRELTLLGHGRKFLPLCIRTVLVSTAVQGSLLLV
jgi:hypothetical protein